MIPFELVGEKVILSPRLPFISLPSEWCDWQLYQAAQLTLRLQCEAVEAGYDLKDASAWNVIFDGGRPVLCDLLSIETLSSKRWWAAGQYARHFILPLLLSRRRGVRVHKIFQAWRDGVPHEVARAMLGKRRFFSRYWPLMAGGGASALPVRERAVDLQDARTFRNHLNHSLGWMLSGVKPRHEKSESTVWQNYIHVRRHYTDEDIQCKRLQVEAWLTRLRPDWVVDLGCNSGEFSRIAANSGASVIAIDADHGAVQRGAIAGEKRIHWAVAQLDDLRGGYGWAGAEHAGLSARLQKGADAVLMLALLHHLVVGASVPIDAIAAWAARCCRRWLLVELIAPDDIQVEVLKAQRNRFDEYPSIECQLMAFWRAGFSLLEKVSLPTSTRQLILLEIARS